MDPYLERPGRWPGFHNLLIAKLAETVAPRLRPSYYVEVEEHVYVSEGHELIGRPDAMVYERRDADSREGPSIRETRGARGGTQLLTAAVPVPDEIRAWYLELREIGSDRVVTVIELLSPSNKRTGKGRQEYLEKRLEIVGTRTNLVEIDLLRAGERMPAFLRDWPPDAPAPGDYRILIARGHRRPVADVYTFTVRDPIPAFPLPLSPDDDEPVVDLQALVHTLNDTMGYDLRIDYRAEPMPPLDEEDEGWVDALLREAGRR